MLEAPRNPQEPIISKRQWGGIGIYGLVLTITVLSAFLYAINVQTVSQAKAVTIGFVTLGVSQLFHVLNMRDTGSHPTHNRITQNRNIWYAIFISMVLIMVTVYIPGLNTVMHTVPLDFGDLGLIFGSSLIPVIVGLFHDRLDIK